jgi:CTP-dependent riboflavin kinase
MSMRNNKPVFILVDTHKDDVIFRIATLETPPSKTYRLEGEAREGHGKGRGNPYLVYGPAIEQELGILKYDCTINVFHVSSGSLSAEGR